MTDVNNLWDIDEDDTSAFEELPVEPEFEDPDYAKPDDQDNDEPENKEQENETTEFDIINEVLKSKGFSDKDNIVIINESGEEEIVKFEDLPDEDKLNILASKETEQELAEAEVEVINFMRENKLTLPEIAEYYKNLGAQEALAKNNQEFTVDDFTDEELFVADLKTKFPDMSDDDILEELDHRKNKPDFFAKQCEKLREEYKSIEEAELEKAKASSLEIEQKEYDEVINSMNEVASSIEEINGMILEDEDKVELLQYILDKDANGRTSIVKALDDPATLYKVAWFLTKGEEANNTIIKYFTEEINKLKQPATQKKQLTTDYLVGSQKQNKKKQITSYDLFNEKN